MCLYLYLYVYVYLYSDACIAVAPLQTMPYAGCAYALNGVATAVVRYTNIYVIYHKYRTRT